jgi:hypothetical protein
MYMSRCVRVIKFSSFNEFPIGFWNCSDSDVFFSHLKMLNGSVFHISVKCQPSDIYNRANSVVIKKVIILNFIHNNSICYIIVFCWLLFHYYVCILYTVYYLNGVWDQRLPLMELILNVYVKEFLSDAHYKYKFKYFIGTNTSTIIDKGPKWSYNVPSLVICMQGTE